MRLPAGLGAGATQALDETVTTAGADCGEAFGTGMKHADADTPIAPISPSGDRRTVRQSLEEYGRGVAGGLLFSLPFLYTMEIWWAGFLIDPAHLLAYMAVTFLLLLGYNRFAGMRRDANFLEVCIDSVEEMGLGLLLAALVLFLIDQINLEMTAIEIMGKIVVESMTIAVGVSVGTAQLGANGPDSQTGLKTDATPAADSAAGEAPHEAQPPPSTVGQLVLAFCGAILFASNVAPTDEIFEIGMKTSTVKLLGLAGLSLLVGAVVLFLSDFRGAQIHVHRGGSFSVAFALITSYCAALLASALMLWFFQRLNDVSLEIAIAQIIVLAFPAMLGASAGRLLIQ